MQVYVNKCDFSFLLKSSSEGILLSVTGTLFEGQE